MNSFEVPWKYLFIDFIQTMSQALSKCLLIWEDIEDKLDYLKNPSKDFYESLAMLEHKIRKGPYF